MLEQEIDLIILRLAEQTIGAHAHYTLAQTASADIPGGIKHYFRSEVIQWLQQDLEPSLHFARVNMSAHRVRRAREVFLRVCVSEYLFPRKEFLATLDNGVHFLMNYLCRPQWTLSEFVFGRETVLDREGLLSKLEYIDDYPHYKTLIKSILERKGWARIDGDQFRSLLSSIDRHYLQQHTGRELVELTAPIFRFLALTHASPSGRIPLKPVLVFFSDKSEHRLKEYIENTCRVRNTTDVSMEELREILGDMPHGSVNTPGTIMQTTGAHKAPDDHPGGMTTTSGGARNRNPALSLTFAGITDKSPAPALPMLDILVSSELRALFINELFSGDAAYYDAIIATLNATPHWKEASLYLNEFYEINKLNPQTEEVMQFTDIVRQRYAAEHPTNP